MKNILASIVIVGPVIAILFLVIAMATDWKLALFAVSLSVVGSVLVTAWVNYIVDKLV